jgi:ribosome biogenesis GTPase A
MPIHWFPGHMNSTRQAIKDRVKAGLDVVIELLDARLPGSSSNPLLSALTTGRPSLKVLNKQDLPMQTRPRHGWRITTRSRTPAPSPWTQGRKRPRAPS